MSLVPIAPKPSLPEKKEVSRTDDMAARVIAGMNLAATEKELKVSATRTVVIEAKRLVKMQKAWATLKGFYPDYKYSVVANWGMAEEPENTIERYMDDVELSSPHDFKAFRFYRRHFRNVRKACIECESIIMEEWET